MLGSTWFKTIGTLFSGCVVGVVLACSWTGAADIDATLEYVNKLEVLIQQHAGNAEALLENLELQKEIYRQDVDVYYRAVQAANQETIKANEELEKANEAALNLRIAVENKYKEIVEDYPVMEVIPGVIKNPDVNHPEGEHDNGTGDYDGCTKPGEGEGGGDGGCGCEEFKFTVAQGATQQPGFATFVITNPHIESYTLHYTFRKNGDEFFGGTYEENKRVLAPGESFEISIAANAGDIVEIFSYVKDEAGKTAYNDSCSPVIVK